MFYFIIFFERSTLLQNVACFIKYRSDQRKKLLTFKEFSDFISDIRFIQDIPHQVFNGLTLALPVLPGVFVV